MSRSRSRELGNNSTIKHGPVVELDGDNQRVRVEFPDEDGTRSFWIDVTSKGASKNAEFDMPDIGDDVWCGLDVAGESGCLIGTRQNKTDRPKQTNPAIKQRNYADGSVESHNTETGERVLTLSSTWTIKGAVHFEGPVLTSNGKDISDTHTHDDVTAGPDKTGEVS